MQCLMLDDSFQLREMTLGLGGFIIDQDQIRALTISLNRLKRRFGIPPDVELKWSPTRDHFLNTSFKGKRNELYRAVLELLAVHDAQTMVTIHVLRDCHGMSKHGLRWTPFFGPLWAL